LVIVSASDKAEKNVQFPAGAAARKRGRPPKITAEQVEPDGPPKVMISMAKFLFFKKPEVLNIFCFAIKFFFFFF